MLKLSLKTSEFVRLPSTNKGSEMKRMRFDDNSSPVPAAKTFKIGSTTADKNFYNPATSGFPQHRSSSMYTSDGTRYID